MPESTQFCLPLRSCRQGGLKPALLLRNCFRYFSLSLQSAWHVSIALLVPYRSDRVYRCSLRDTPEEFRLQFQAALHRRRQQEKAESEGFLILRS